MHNLSCENEFYLHENEKSFPYQRLSTYPRFDTEARRNAKMAYYGNYGNGLVELIFRLQKKPETTEE